MTEVTLDRCWELRYEVPAGSVPGKIELVPEDGKFAEINGAEIAPGKTYELAPGTSGSIYTWHGCTLKLEHLTDEQVYTAEEPAMEYFARAHSQLEEKRRSAKDGIAEHGPRVLVCGAPSSGKLSLCKILVNYAARLDWHLTFADLDISNNSISVPGSISAVPIDVPIPFPEGFSLLPPVSFFYGGTSLEVKGDELYLQLITSLASMIDKRHEHNSNEKCGGIIVKAMSSGTPQHILHSVKAFSIDTVFVVGDDKLHAQLSQLFTKEGLKISLVQMPRSGGCTTKFENQREAERALSIKQYFSGWQHMKLHPHGFMVTDTDKFSFVKFGFVAKGIKDNLPIGQDSVVKATDATLVTVSKDLENCLVAFSQGTDIDNIATAPVYGYGRVTFVSPDGKNMNILVPLLLTQLPCQFIIAGDITSFDSL